MVLRLLVGLLPAADDDDDDDVDGLVASISILFDSASLITM